ncbi:MAG: hypothetical protein H7A37_02845 [Chlamydiales bacterium]|nr:hypothetical protein [Chlamydiales bacterium]
MSGIPISGSQAPKDPGLRRETIAQGGEKATYSGKRYIALANLNSDLEIGVRIVATKNKSLRASAKKIAEYLKKPEGSENLQYMSREQLQRVQTYLGDRAQKSQKLGNKITSYIRNVKWEKGRFSSRTDSSYYKEAFEHAEQALQDQFKSGEEQLPGVKEKLDQSIRNLGKGTKNSFNEYLDALGDYYSNPTVGFLINTTQEDGKNLFEKIYILETSSKEKKLAAARFLNTLPKDKLAVTQQMFAIASRGYSGEKRSVPSELAMEIARKVTANAQRRGYATDFINDSAVIDFVIANWQTVSTIIEARTEYLGNLLLRSDLSVEGILRESASPSLVADLEKQVDQLKITVTDPHVQITVTDPHARGTLYSRALREYFSQPSVRNMFNSKNADEQVILKSENDQEKKAAAIRIFQSLPPSEQRVVDKLLVVTQAIKDNASTNKMDAKNLARVLSPNVIHDDDQQEAMNNSGDNIKILEFFIENGTDIRWGPLTERLSRLRSEM